MQKTDLLPAETLRASQEGTLVIEQFLMANYRFRRNILNGKVEFAILLKADNKAEGNTVETSDSLSCASDEADLDYRPLTPAALNSIVIRAKREQVMEKGSPKTEITEYVQSEEVPQHLREYYLDHLNLANKFDKEMALTNNLFVNLDELDAIRPSQQSSLKQTLSVSKVNGRPIFGKTQEDRPRFASFVATTNNRHPLKDVTGSRRNICILIPDGQLIDNTGDIDYGQLYAQVVYELKEQKAPYWFNNDEVTRIQQLNQDFMEKKDLAEIFMACFRQPREGEVVKTMNCDQMMSIMQKDYPTLQNTIGNRVRLGKTISAMGFEHKEHSHVAYYKVVLLRAA